MYKAIKALNELYGEVVCPVCGMRANYICCGGNFTVKSCGHPEMVKLIAERETLLVDFLKNRDE